jgi:hypothetical protein
MHFNTGDLGRGMQCGYRTGVYVQGITVIGEIRGWTRAGCICCWLDLDVEMNGGVRVRETKGESEILGGL